MLSPKNIHKKLA